MTGCAAGAAGGPRAWPTGPPAPTRNPCPPGQIGRTYRPLTDAQIDAITETAFRLLTEIRMGEVPDRLASDLGAAGATRAGDRVLIPRETTRRAIACALSVAPGWSSP